MRLYPIELHNAWGGLHERISTLIFRGATFCFPVGRTCERYAIDCRDENFLTVFDTIEAYELYGCQSWKSFQVGADVVVYRNRAVPFKTPQFMKSKDKFWGLMSPAKGGQL